MFTDPFIAAGYSVLLFSLAMTAGYVLGKRHGMEDAHDYIQEFISRYSFVSNNPITYKCCDHCVLPDGEFSSDHWVPDEDGEPTNVRRFHFHSEPCNESFCLKGMQINTQERAS